MAKAKELIEATKRNDVGRVLELLKNGVKMTKTGKTALDYAILNNNKVIANMLITNGFKPRNNNILGSVILNKNKNNRINMMKFLINMRLFNLNKAINNDKEMIYGTPLFIAASNNRLSIVELLINNNINIHKPIKYDMGLKGSIKILDIPEDIISYKTKNFIISKYITKLIFNTLIVSIKRKIPLELWTEIILKNINNEFTVKQLSMTDKRLYNIYKTLLEDIPWDKSEEELEDILNKIKETEQKINEHIVNKVDKIVRKYKLKFKKRIALKDIKNN
jgi:ankyrin repeat protein